ncbi:MULTISPECIES: OsmC family protein [Lactobacillus]|uniref:OsmC family peroxiredoxin n=1 Tax=Lactobacillus xujianguonis TaxID=2495899 RepID=A0A437SXM5_9LACO|nr:MULTISPECIES: OsmC family protein [Lactobacillus]RVU71684.1 OsmC family peroxiredoxin [Lactobacillus xujianguonis]RVU77665.1 OsmC family peroxiredoxin [Lactobacillus xujianguonis]
MSSYSVNSHSGDKEWQVINQARDYQFIGDAADHAGGPNPVEYLCGAVNTCLSISAQMLAKAHHLDVKNFHLETSGETKKLAHGKSIVAAIEIKVFFDSSMPAADQEKFLKRVLEISTVYQTVKLAVPITVTRA